MTGPQHRRFLSEVGADLAVFATKAEVLRVQEELAHHLEEKKYILLDQGLSEEEAESQSITDFGPRRELVKEARAALRGPFRRLNAATLLAGSSFFLIFPLQYLAVNGAFSILLGVLLAGAAFYFAVSGVQYGARITVARTIVLCLVAGASFLLPIDALIVAGHSHFAGDEAPTEVWFVPSKPIAEAKEYVGTDGLSIIVSPGPNPPVARLDVQKYRAKQGVPQLPRELEEMMKTAASMPAGPPAPRFAQPETAAMAAWLISCLAIVLGGMAASLLGARLRASQDQRVAIPPPPPKPLEGN